MLEKIVIATNGSDASQLAVREGLDLAEDVHAAVTVVTVRQPISFLGAPFYKEELSRQLAWARVALARARDDAAARRVQADYEMLEGDPAKQILAIARSCDADLVVVGSRGLGTMAGALLGSVSRAVVRGADRPVLVVKDSERPEARKGSHGRRGAATRT